MSIDLYEKLNQKLHNITAQYNSHHKKNSLNMTRMISAVTTSIDSAAIGVATIEAIQQQIETR